MVDYNALHASFWVLEVGLAILWCLRLFECLLLANGVIKILHFQKYTQIPLFSEKELAVS